jgi:PAS domain S-box-containing protein
VDRPWLVAPVPAVKVWRESKQLRWCVNAPGAAWARETGLTDADWRAFGAELLDGPQGHGHARLGKVGVDWTACELHPGRLAWLVPDASEPSIDPMPAFGSAVQRLETMQEFGRIGLFERHIASGKGYWDRHMFRLFGLDPAGGTPSFEAATQRVHPEDRASIFEWHRRFAEDPGRRDVRYRLLLPDGRVRDIHSQIEARPGPDGKPATVIGVVIDDTESAGRLRAQEALAAKLARAIDLARVSVWHYDLAQGWMQFNATGYRVMGLPADSPGIGVDAVRATIHPDDHAAVVRAAEEAMQRSDAVDVEARYRNPDGSWRHLLTRRVAERDEKQRVVALAGVSIDQTERMAERERAQALNRRLELVAAAAGLGLWSIDLEGAHVEWNAQMAELYGLAVDAPPPTLRRWIGVHVHRDDRRRVASQWRRSQAAGDAGFDIDFRIVRPDGAVRWVACRARREQRAGQPWLVGIHLDISERRATEAALQRQQERLAMATRAAGAGIWEREVEGPWLYWSEQMYRLRGLAPDDPRTIAEIVEATVDPARRAELLQLTRRHMTEGVPFEAELRVVWPDGSVHWLATAGRVVRDEHGRPLRMTGVNWDITQHKLAETALRDKEAAERASRAKSEFLARMSHELRTPLNAVIGFAQLIEHDASAPLGAVQRDRVAHIRAAGAHLLALIEDVLDLAAIESATLPIVLEPVALDAALDDVQRWVAPLAERGGVTLHLPRCGRWVVADARRLRQVLANLLTNAIKYNRVGGSVWVEVSVPADPDAPDALAGVIVRDDGRGMSAGQVEHLFEPFNRLGAEREAIEGVGIGLMIVRHLVQFMGGRVEVSSALGQGSEFTIWLQAAAGPLPQAGASLPAARAAPERTPERLAVLYIEDNPVNVLLVEEMVALRSHIALHCVVDGAAGVAAAIASAPDVVLVDMQLPDMDGFEVLRRLRAHPALEGTVLVALSANAMPEDVARARDAGFDDYWTKPIDIDRFLGGLDKLSYGARRSRSHAPASSR